MLYNYTLDIPTDYRRSLAIAWLWLAVLTLLGAGIFSVLLVLSRTPMIGEMIPFTDFFHTALVIHVNLSSLVWILSFASVLWCLNSRSIYPWLARMIFVVVLVGTAIIAISPFFGDANALMSNYIPILDAPLYLSGLIIFGIGIGLQVIFSMSAMFKVGEAISGQGVIRFGLNCAAIGTFIALAAFIWSYIELPLSLASQTYYEVLFWNGGHVLQFTYTLLMMVAWIWLSSSAGISLPLSPRVALLLFGIGLLSVFMTPLAYYAHDVTSVVHRQMFTTLMRFGGSLAIVPLGMAILFALFQKRTPSPMQSSAHAALLTSLLLFGVGGMMGFMIDGNNVKIPAHYHGCIVGVSLALMGLTYQLLPALGFNKLNFRLTGIQLYIYALGQFLHILGLVWSGGYGVERKVADAAQGLDSMGHIAGMGLMGLGGLLSAIGGFMFVVIVIKALMNNSGGQAENNTSLAEV
jgi:cytochrome c oxidase subunit 1